MDRFEPDRRPDEARFGAPVAARGLLLALAVPSVAGLAAAPDSRAAAIVGMLGALFTTPALIFVSGYLLRAPLRDRDDAQLRRAGLRFVVCAAAATAAAAALGVAAGADWRAGLSSAAPALHLVVAPAFYVLIVLMAGRSTTLLFGIAVLAHIAGVAFHAPLMADLIYFVGGLILADRASDFAGLIAEEPYFAAASAPFVAALALIACSRIGPAAEGADIADIGPIALALGLAAGPAALASAGATAGTSIGDFLRRLGRAAPAAAIFWLPLFFTILSVADRGGAPTASSLALFALASLLAVFVAADAAAEWRSGALAGAQRSRGG